MWPVPLWRLQMDMFKIPMAELAELIKIQLEEGGRAELTVTGSSMHPLFHSRRDKVILIPRVAKKPDVILYRRDNGAYILHRIVRVKGDMFIVTGDNQWVLEEVRPDQVLAVVDYWYKNGKKKTTKSLWYKLYVWFWVGCLPLRRPILALRRRVGKLIRKIKRRK